LAITATRREQVVGYPYSLNDDMRNCYCAEGDSDVGAERYE